MSTETQTWYQVSIGGRYEIKPRQVVRTTPKQVIYLEPHWSPNKPPMERRGARESSWDRWFETKDEAVEYVRGCLTAKVASTEVAAERAASALAIFNAAHPLVSHTNAEKEG